MSLDINPEGLSAGIQMRDQLLMEWEPHTSPEYPGDAESVRFAFFDIYDRAYDLLRESGQGHDEAVSTVRVVFGASLPGGPG